MGASSDTILVGPSLDVSSARHFARAISRMTDRRLPHVIVDMSKTQTVDSSGFGALISGLKKMNEGGSTPLVVCSNATVRRLMDFTGVSRMFTVVERTGEARQLMVQASTDVLAS
jgi:anti-anti-sigma factor